MSGQSQISLQPLPESSDHPYQDVPSRAVISKDSSVRRRTPRNKKSRNSRRLKENKRTFDRLADIYLQNPHFLKKEQLYSILEMTYKPKPRSQVIECILPQEKHTTSKIQERIQYQLEKRKIEGAFRISAKHFTRNSINYRQKYLEKTLQVPAVEEPQSNHPQSSQIKRTIVSPNLFQKKKIQSNSTAQPSISIASHQQTHFRRYRYQRKNSQQAVRLSTTIKRPTTEHGNRQVNYNNFFNYILNSKDEHIKRELEKQGWKQNRVIQSNVFVLKWSYKDDPEDYRTLEQPSCIERYFNHIKYNDMTSKAGLLRLYRQLCQAGSKPSGFIPRTHDLTEESDIANDYYFTAVLIILKKHIKYFESKIPKQVHILRRLIERKKRKSFPEETLEQFFKNCMDPPQKDQNFVVNLPLLRQVLMLIEMKIKLTQGDSESIVQYQSLLDDPKITKTLLKFSKINPPYEQLIKIGKSNLNEQFAKPDRVPDSPSRKISWWTPSLDLVHRCLLYHNYFSKNSSSYLVDGLNNIWIVKPCSSSRGQGIYLTDKLQSILESRSRGRLAQKYIEKAFVLDQRKLLNVSQEIKQQLRAHPLYGRKFDLRQWVLIGSVNPLEVYIFSEFYLKICPEKYDCKELGSLSKHLSNYSINKQMFNDPSTSIMSQPDFSEILGKIGIQIGPLKQKIREIVIDMVRVGSQTMEHITGTFELLGFDILLDDFLNPWILQVNMSPACSERAPWVTTMLEQMTKKTFSIILPKKFYKPIEDELDPQRFVWEKVISEEKFVPQKFDKLELFGTRFNVACQRRRQKLFKQSTQKQFQLQLSKVCLVQRKIRQFLTKKRLKQEF